VYVASPTLIIPFKTGTGECWIIRTGDLRIGNIEGRI
jgi:hypothetical protein